MSYLHYMCLLVNSGVQHILCYVFPLFVLVYVVSDLRQVGGFIPVLRFPPPIKLTATI
jgi:hypothetical protein